MTTKHGLSFLWSFAVNNVLILHSSPKATKFPSFLVSKIVCLAYTTLHFIDGTRTERNTNTLLHMDIYFLSLLRKISNVEIGRLQLKHVKHFYWPSDLTGFAL